MLYPYCCKIQWAIISFIFNNSWVNRVCMSGLDVEDSTLLFIKIFHPNSRVSGSLTAQMLWLWVTFTFVVTWFGVLYSKDETCNWTTTDGIKKMYKKVTTEKFNVEPKKEMGRIESNQINKIRRYSYVLATNKFISFHQWQRSSSSSSN